MMEFWIRAAVLARGHIAYGMILKLDKCDRMSRQNFLSRAQSIGNLAYASCMLAFSEGRGWIARADDDESSFAGTRSSDSRKMLKWS